MAQTYQAVIVSEGKQIDYTPVGAVVAGQVVMLITDGLIGVAPLPIAAGVLGSLVVSGIFDVVHVDNNAVAVGTPLYWDDNATPNQTAASTTGACTTSGTQDGFIGFSLEANSAHVVDVDDHVRVLWTGPAAIANTSHIAATHVYADPATAGTLTVIRSGICGLTFAGTETRIISPPPFVGCLLALSAWVATSGTATVTVSDGGTVNDAGDLTLVFTHAGETCLLCGVDIGGTLTWRMICNDGATHPA